MSFDKNLQNNADFQSQLPLLKERLLAMGGEVEEQVRSAVRSLVDRDIDLAEKTLLETGQLIASISKLTNFVLI